MKKRWECSIGGITFLAKLAYSTVYLNTFSETTRPIELTFHIETPYVKGSKFIANGNGNMTKMAVRASDRQKLKIGF